MMESVRYEMNRYPFSWPLPLPLLPGLMVDPTAIQNVLQPESLTIQSPSLGRFEPAISDQSDYYLSAQIATMSAT